MVARKNKRKSSFHPSHSLPELPQAGALWVAVLLQALYQLKPHWLRASEILRSTMALHSGLHSRQRRWLRSVYFRFIRQYGYYQFLLERIENLHSPSALRKMLAAFLLDDGNTRDEVIAWTSSSEDRSALEIWVDAFLSQKETLLASLSSHQRNQIDSFFPQWLYEKMQQQYHDEAFPLLQSLNEPSPITIRVNVSKISRMELQKLFLQEYQLSSEYTQLSPWGLHLEKRVDFSKLPAYRDGYFEVQDEGSQLIALLTQARPGEKVVDYCAGAGGKTLALATMMENQGEITACDIHREKLYNLRLRAKRNGVTNLHTINLRENPSLQIADCVLVDAPCTGMGTQRRKPETRWWLTEDKIQSFARQQQEILELSSVLVRSGGRLVYATCSLLQDENEDIVNAFLARHNNWQLQPARTVLPFIEGDFLQLLPHQHSTDGFFAAVLQKMGPPTTT